MTIGLPRSLFYYRYNTLFKAFFKELGINYVVSNITNKKLLETGKKYAPAEACIGLKLFLGHLDDLKNKTDYILVPRLESIKKNEKVCTNFYVLYDLANNIFDYDILSMNIDYNKNITIKDAFINLGIDLGYGYLKSNNAFIKANEIYRNEKKNKLLEQTNILNSKNKKILVVGHSYIINDPFLFFPIKKVLNKNNFKIIDSNICDSDGENIDYTYFSYNKMFISAIEKYKDFVNGIIIVSAFPCGPDSITNEFIIRKNKNIPILQLIIDESDSITGLNTRLESFIDIVNGDCNE